jgi:hypothetical protein
MLNNSLDPLFYSRLKERHTEMPIYYSFSFIFTSKSEREAYVQLKEDRPEASIPVPSHCHLTAYQRHQL